MGEKGQVGLHTMSFSLGGVGQALQAGVEGVEQGVNDVGSVVSGLTTTHNPPGAGGSSGTAGDQGSEPQINNPLYPGQASQGGEKGNAIPISTQPGTQMNEGVLPVGRTLTGSMSTSTAADNLASSTPPTTNPTIR
jgi:hypothetical protein